MMKNEKKIVVKHTIRKTDRSDRLAPNNKYLMISSGFA